jgi:hypothetical protein
VEARTPQEIENAFSMMAHDKAQAVIVLADGFFNQQRRQISELAIRNRSHRSVLSENMQRRAF